ncbi:hypothetical protein Glove_117g82 [Diversispora epigaea]|uniref:TLDc domain-containing protein n=1 Tax=Diversispora epigaea TaxID=1348612 RepID=A0A397J0T9_9GLOM|nr:hypothetical protein Glove_117g82 [Diversispora epigaea]
MALKFFDKLSQNFIELLNDKIDYNSNENNIKTIIKSRISAQIFDVILNDTYHPFSSPVTLVTFVLPQYIYGGIVNLESVETKFIFELMLAADEFELEELANKIETFLIETKASWLRTHFSMVYDTIFDRKKFDDLQNFCNDIIAKHPGLIFERSDFNSLPESALVSLLMRDNLQMKEVKIWDYVIKWGISQNSTLPTNLREWSNENFLTLKTTLQQCLPYIRYFHLSVDEVLDSIKPYKKILDEQLWDEINQHLLSPERPVESIILPARSVLVTELPPRAEEPKKPFSTIISEDHAAEISSWIDLKTTIYSTADIPYKFELILRGSRDGFAPQTFWDICLGHAGTILVMKVKGTNEILGGYNPLAWNNSNIKNKWMETNDSFIFSLKMYQHRYGPYFGYDFYMRSLNSNNFTIDNDCFYEYGGCYEKTIRSSQNCFSIVDYEIFKIVKKS